MAIRVVKESAFGRLSRGFRFENHEDKATDSKLYDLGRNLENARFKQGSLGQKIFDRLSTSSKARIPSKKK